MLGNFSWLSFSAVLVLCYRDSHISVILTKGYVLLRRVNSIKVICEKVIFQTENFVILFMTMNRHTYRLFKNTFHDIQTEVKLESFQYNPPTTTRWSSYLETL